MEKLPQGPENPRFRLFEIFPKLSTKNCGPPQFSHKLTLVFCCDLQHIAAEYRKCMRVMSKRCQMIVVQRQ